MFAKSHNETFLDFANLAGVAFFAIGVACDWRC